MRYHKLLKHLKLFLQCCFADFSEDGKLSCGYSSFRGKRASMEDFFDVKISKIDGQTVSLFGVFDGRIILLLYEFFFFFFQFLLL